MSINARNSLNFISFSRSSKTCGDNKYDFRYLASSNDPVFPTLNKEEKPIPESVSLPAFLTTTSDDVKNLFLPIP